MKQFIGLFLFVIAVGCTHNPAHAPVDSKLMPDNKIWMTRNLDINLPDSYCEADDTVHCTQYGRLYTWESAKQGCRSMGKGWRLPTDTEWRALAKSFGGIHDDSADEGRSAYRQLTPGGTAGFDALLGGNREPDGSYRRLGAHGFYWTSTAYDSAEAWFYNFGKEAGLLNRHTGTKKRAMSVRCICDSLKRPG